MIVSNLRRAAVAAALLVAATCIGCNSTHPAIGNDADPSFASASYVTVPVPRTVDHYPRLSDRAAPLVVNRHTYPPSAR